MNKGTTIPRAIRRVCVYCASSRKVDARYFEAAEQLGRLLAREGITLVYGGGGSGLMGALADGALKEGGHVLGVLPRFMNDVEWGHPGLSELRLVNDLHERKRIMIENTDAVVALPGGSGTLEELFEAVTLKRLGLYVNPIVLVNISGFFDPLLTFLEGAIRENFMDVRHRAMWSHVSRADEVVAAIQHAAPWGPEARDFARI